MDALQAYHSSDSEGESDSPSQPEFIPSKERKEKQVGLTSRLPKPDLNFEFGAKKRTSEEVLLSPLLPWSKAKRRQRHLEKKTDGQSAGKGRRAYVNEFRNKNEHTPPLVSRDRDFDQLVPVDLHSFDQRSGLDRQFMHPHRFGPQNPANSDDDTRVMHAPAVQSWSSKSREGSINRRSGVTGPASAATKRVSVTQPYVPKRLRQEDLQESSGTHLNDAHPRTSHSKDTMYTLHSSIAHQLERSPLSKPPRRRTWESHSHSGPVTHVRWCLPQFSHLLLSSSMDRTVQIWRGIGGVGGQCLKTIDCHRGAVKDAQWVDGGRSVLSCGFDKMARITDVESGKELQGFEHSSYVTCLKTKPDDPSIFICGTYNSSISCWDIRTGNMEHEYKGRLGQILDLEFLPGCEEFASSCDVVSRDSADRTIMVWDHRSTAVVSNQLYHEKYTCPCLKAHPSDSVFVAQSTANYMAIFSTVRPYKLNKFKRYEGHQLEGHHIGCDWTPDGVQLVSGSSDGKAYVYDYRTTRLLKTLQCFTGPCIDVACHPILPGVVAACSWDGSVTVWQ